MGSQVDSVVAMSAHNQEVPGSNLDLRSDGSQPIPNWFRTGSALEDEMLHL